MNQEESWVSRSGKRIIVLASNEEVTSRMHLGLIQRRLSRVKSIDAFLESIDAGRLHQVFYKRSTDLRCPFICAEIAGDAVWIVFQTSPVPRWG